MIEFVTDIRQCLIYDTPYANARLIGVEYMISPRVYETLPKEERQLWHSHQYEIKSGMLVMPAPPGRELPDCSFGSLELYLPKIIWFVRGYILRFALDYFQVIPMDITTVYNIRQKAHLLLSSLLPGTPVTVWSAAELEEMKDLFPVYGKTYHLWQIDRGDTVPMGPPQLMGSFTSHEDVVRAKPGGLKELLAERDARFGVDHTDKAERRKDIPEVPIHPGTLFSVAQS